MSISPLSPSQLLELIPQQSPFRFVDEIAEVDDLKILGSYRFRETEDFYRGHFPGNPVTPGVILLECMCQIGVVAHGIYLLGQETSQEEARLWTTMFSDAQVDFLKPVLPGQKVTVRGERIFWRRKKLRSKLEMFAADGSLVAQATASGIGVKHGPT
jgi:3-hydroxyacyl-[acyl-carrier-protein] dehydratase